MNQRCQALLQDILVQSHSRNEPILNFLDVPLGLFPIISWASPFSCFFILGVNYVGINLL